MSQHRASRTAPGRARRGPALGLIAAAVAPLAGFTLVAPALADTSAPEAANAAGSALGLPSLPGDTPIVDVDIPDACLDLSAEVDRLQSILDGAGATASEAQKTAVANAKLALGTCVDNETDDATPTPTPTTTPPTSTTTAPPTSTTSLPPLGGALGGTSGEAGESTSRIPANADGETQADRQGSNTQVLIPRGAADTGDGSFPTP
jgi:hypothetical protein